MIPSDIRLYTWVDVEEVLLRIQEQNNWPQWLVWARAYWDGLTIGIRPDNQEEAKNWLRENYEPRFRISSEEEIIECWIILESVPENERILPIYFEETEEEPPLPKLTPSLSRPSVIWQPREDVQTPESLPESLPPVVAFHSFKGGVGRTTHALALAQVLTEEKQRVLLVDADMEAPGISWVFERRLPIPPVSFADFLALAHGDPSPDAQTAIQLVADRLESALIDNIYILPSFRSNNGFTSLEIRPEHLIQGAKNPFIITEILAKLGQTLRVDVVIVDLRAGLSELATGLILDPRVYRVFVTTLSGQAISGTTMLLELIGKKALSTKETDPSPALIISQIPKKDQGSNLVSDTEYKLLEAAKPFISEDQEPVSIITSFDENLLVLPTSWEEVITRIKGSGIQDKIRRLIDWLPVQRGESVQEDFTSLQSQRERLRDRSQQLVFAENAEVKSFLPTVPLRNLASDHRHRLPIAVIVGAKGSGKTYTFLQIVHRKTWENFAQDAEATEVNANGLIAPLLESKNLKDVAKDLVREVRKTTARALGFAEPQDASTIRDYIREGCQLNLHEGQWRDRWLNAIAWGVGFQPQTEGAGRELTKHLVTAKQKLVVVIDGLEDLFQNFASDESQQTALRALLQEVPEWLNQQPGLPLGILIFVRRDILLAAIRQNAAQMMARYETYALKWNREEALRLVAWVTQIADICRNIHIYKLQDMSEVDLTEALVPLWGQRLGTERSKEAPSARWVIAALSDFRGQIQARDLVRLLHLAAKGSVNDERWKDRILIPKAIKEALPECSSEKIGEIEVENTELKNIFTKLRDLEEDKRKIPFTRDTVQLSLEEMKILEDNGVVFRENDEYYMPEIFRSGLGFSLTAPGRAKVITLARRAERKN
jgi:MinD-like ATPase involved in chromosome partitioning or flagellar assembly